LQQLPEMQRLAHLLLLLLLDVPLVLALLHRSLGPASVGLAACLQHQLLLVLLLLLLLLVVTRAMLRHPGLAASLQ
jgi:hypothetical protein